MKIIAKRSNVLPIEKTKKQSIINFNCLFNFKSSIFPQILGIICFLCITLIDYLLSCDFSFWSQAFRYFVETFFDVGFYHFFLYHMLFPYIFENMKSEQNRKFARFTVCFIFAFILLLFQYLVKSRLVENFMYMHWVNLLTANLLIFIFCQMKKIEFSKIKQNYYQKK